MIYVRGGRAPSQLDAEQAPWNFQAKGSGSFTPQAGWTCEHLHLRRWLCPSCRGLSSLSHSPNLIEALRVLEPLSYDMEYVLESTNAPNLTVPRPFICAREALGCLALCRPGRRSRDWLPLSTRTHSNRPCPPTPSRPCPPTQAILWEFVHFNYE